MAGKFAALRGQPLEQPLSSSSRWIDVGDDQPVTIEDLDASQVLTTQRVTITIKDDSGAGLKENLFVLNRDGTGLSQLLRSLVGALLPDLGAQRAFIDLMADDATCPRVLESFRGMRSLVTVKRRAGGYVTDVDQAAEEYVAAVDGKEIARHRDLAQVKKLATTRGYKPAYKTIDSFGVIDDATKESNLKAFRAVVASISNTAPADDPTAAHAVGPDGRTAKW